ncbi:MAG: tRNA lysidine(34) synthetase TilS [Alcaligenaceae bacterium]|nr:tRNA lysidine(34) synthetase TilS [Alcaligenaceae bacterium]
MAHRYLPRGFSEPRLLAPVLQVFDALAPGQPRPLHVAVALSGGADSAMLAVHAALAVQQRAGIELHCFHIHHGLQQAADGWQEHVHALAAGLGLPCHSLRVEVAEASGKGVEGAARDARYAGLKRLAESTGVSHILLAHHRDDQTETVLMRLLRGTGPAGLAAMAAIARRDGVTYLRPWLEIDRALILASAREYAGLSGWTAVDDPTNLDDAYTRGAVRQRLAPVLDERWPAWRSILLRHARQARELAGLLEEVAAEDFARLDADADLTDFSLAAWRELSPERQILVLRHWLGLHGLRAPTDARMRELCRQLRNLHALGHDRSMRLRHEGRWILCQRGRVRLSHMNDTTENL